MAIQPSACNLDHQQAMQRVNSFWLSADLGTPNLHGTSQPKTGGLRGYREKTSISNSYFCMVFKQSFEDLPTGEVLNS